MTTDPDISGLIAAALAVPIAISVFILAIRHSYRAKGRSQDFRLVRILAAFALLGGYFFGLLASGLYLQKYWNSAAITAVVVGFLTMVFAALCLLREQ